MKLSDHFGLKADFLDCTEDLYQYLISGMADSDSSTP
jgi:hypothetical protein